MAQDNNKPRPVRKLTVDNFSVSASPAENFSGGNQTR